MDYVPLVLSLSVLAVIVGGLIQRCICKKGIGWQFIRYTVIGVSLPMCCLLALNGSLTEGAVAIISGAMGFAFGKVGNDD
ncbi:MAG: hypothetical protein K2Q01_12485 [Rickettsiales bacterium]|nr:hypothetical protein [Rickettsiales bacterium]